MLANASIVSKVVTIVKIGKVGSVKKICIEQLSRQFLPLNPMPTPPRRRWYQVSIRGLLVLVALSAVVFAWVAYELEWKRQRQLVLNKYQNASGDLKAPSLLWLFGTRGFERVGMKFEGFEMRALKPAEKEELQRARQLFPEAQVVAGFQIREIHPDHNRYVPFEPVQDE